jgi:hypothetical protein
VSLAVLGALLCACGAQVRASADWERGADLSPSKTFGVARSPLLPKDLTPQQTQLVAIVEDTIKRELARKGYQEAPVESARLVATSHFLVRERSRVNAYTCDNYWQYEMYEGAVLPSGAVAPCQESVVSNFDEGVLMIDVYDAERKELVWHGWASGERPTAGSASGPDIVHQATLDILERFPP